MIAGGLGMPMLIGDEQTPAGLVHAGIAEEDACEYCVIGCNELGIPGKQIYDGVGINDIALLRDVLLDPDAPQRVGSMDDLMEEFGARLRVQLRERVQGKQRARRAWLERVPPPSPHR